MEQMTHEVKTGLGEQEDIDRAFSDITPKEAKELHDGLLPFVQPGNWVEALCRRLFPLAAQSEPWDQEDTFRHEFFSLFLSEAADGF